VTVAFIFLAACIQTMNRDPGLPALETFSPLGAVYAGYGVLAIYCTAVTLSFFKFILWRLGLRPRSERGQDPRLLRERSPAESSA